MAAITLVCEVINLLEKQCGPRYIDVKIFNQILAQLNEIESLYEQLPRVSEESKETNQG